MSEWNYNMDEAPRGRTEVRTHMDGKGREVSREVFVPDLIIAAGEGGIVTVSRWIPKHSRWNMFAHGETPLAWMPWPTHPEARL